MSTIALDAHVHLHDPATALATLRRADASFDAAAPDSDQRVVLLAERSGINAFEHLRDLLVPTGEPGSLWQDERRRLLVGAGRQVVTSEGLEVLGLATSVIVPDGLSADEAVERLQAADAIIVLPWGAGKWLGARGRLVDRLTSRQSGQLFLGDNGGRPWFWRVPRFRSNASAMLSGSDPLPLAGTESAIGSIGSLVAGSLPALCPLVQLKRLLRDPSVQLGSYGGPASARRFLVDQTRLRLASRAPAK